VALQNVPANAPQRRWSWRYEKF